MASDKPETLALTFHLPLEHLDALQGFMLMTTEVEGVEELADGSVRYFLASDAWDDALRERLEAFLLRVGSSLDNVQREAIAQRDWNAEWESSIEPVRVTDALIITPSWKREEASLVGAEYMIVIDPKMSFGTGHHATTRLCLRAIERIDVQAKEILDLGTGSGVLAIYALMRGAKHALGVDTDEWAVENTIENRERNMLSADAFVVRQGTLEIVVPEDVRFEILIANIHRNILLSIAEELTLHAASTAELILSGLLQYDAAEVTVMYESCGWQLQCELKEDEWSALHFNRTRS